MKRTLINLAAQGYLSQFKPAPAPAGSNAPIELAAWKGLDRLDSALGEPWREFLQELRGDMVQYTIGVDMAADPDVTTMVMVTHEDGKVQEAEILPGIKPQAPDKPLKLHPWQTKVVQALMKRATTTIPWP